MGQDSAAIWGRSWRTGRGARGGGGDGLGRLSCAPHRPPALRTHMKLSAALLLGVVALAMAGGQEASVNSVAARRLGERPQGRQKAKVRGVLGADGTGDQTRPLVTSLGFGVIFVFFFPLRGSGCRLRCRSPGEEIQRHLHFPTSIICFVLGAMDGSIMMGCR